MFALRFRSLLVTLLLFVIAALIMALGAWARDEREPAVGTPGLRQRSGVGAGR